MSGQTHGFNRVLPVEHHYSSEKHFPTPAALRRPRSVAGQPAAASGASAPGAAPFAGASRYEPDPAFQATVHSIEQRLAGHLRELRAEKLAARRWRLRFDRLQAGYFHFMDETLFTVLLRGILILGSILVWTHLLWPKVIFPAGTWLLRALGVL